MGASPRPRPSLAGTRLARVARAIVDETTYADVVTPAVADLQYEVQAAGRSRRKRIAARCRGYWALVKVLHLASLAAPSPVSGRPGAAAVHSPGFLLLLAAVLVAATWPFFGGFAVASCAAGGVTAMAMRVWHARHPSTVAARERERGSRGPEINLSAIPVGGDAGGLIVVVGAVFIVVLGIPQLRWLIAAAAASASLFAAALLLWRRSHWHGTRASSVTMR